MKKIRFLINVAYWSIIGLFLILAFRYIVPPVLPFLFGFGVAAAFHPWVSKISREKSRWWGTVAIIIPFWSILLLLLCTAGFALYKEAIQILKWIQNTDFNELIVSVSLPGIPENLIDYLVEKSDKFFPTLLELSQKALTYLANLIMSLPDALLFSFATVVSSVLFSVSYPKIEPFVLRQLPARYQTEYFDIKEFLIETIFRFLKAHGIMFSISYGELLVGLLLLKAPYPFIFAAIIALFDLLPYVGMASILVPWGLISWLVFGNPVQGVGLIVLAVIVSVARELLEPRILGKTIGLSALATLFSVYLGMKVMGFAGVFLFPLIFLFLKEWNNSGRIFLWKNRSE